MSAAWDTSTGVGVELLTREEFDQDVADRLDGEDDATDYSGWYCIRTDPFPCPASGCGFVATHATAAHMIVVWPEKDDLQLLRVAADCQRFGRNPRVVEWQPAEGPCVSYYLWARMGRPVHGKHPRPEGWPERPDHE